eukprot:scaffold760_cov307-Pinguiococcus_pyrenoidosus.AAC.2
MQRQSNEAAELLHRTTVDHRKARRAAERCRIVRDLHGYEPRRATTVASYLAELCINNRADAVLNFLAHASRKELLVKVQHHRPGFDVLGAESALLCRRDWPFWIFHSTDEVATYLRVAIAVDLEFRASAAARQPLEGDAAASKGRNQNQRLAGGILPVEGGQAADGAVVQVAKRCFYGLYAAADGHLFDLHAIAISRALLAVVVKGFRPHGV